VARDRDRGQSRTVREFITEFRGLSGTARQRRILHEVGCSYQSLASFFGVDQVNRAGIARLLEAMQRHCKPVAPQHLGIIGAEHFKERFAAAGGAVETFKYQCRKGIIDGIPYVIEFCFGLHGLEKVVPDDDLLAETYRAFHRSQRLRERFKEMEQQFDKEAAAADIPEGLEQRVRAVLAEHADLRWDEAIQVVLDETQLSRVRAEKEKAKKKSGDFTSDSDDDETVGDA
jgi:hypothetical protein